MKTELPPVAIPPEILTQHTGVLGKTGSGKTTTAKVIVESVVRDGYRVCVLDPIKSDWWGVSTSADGKGRGMPFVVVGGPYGHLPISTSSAAALGELVGDGQLPLSVLDLANLEPGGVQKFFVAFAESLWRSARRGVLYLVLEEAHEFAPKERAGFGAENMAIHWAKKLATGARTKGIRLIVATQRTQALHNAVLGSCETMIVHRITQPADQKPVLGWLRANVQDDDTRRDIESSMSSLKTGTGWICSGEAQIFRRVQFPRIATYDNSATPTGDDEEHGEAVRPADVDLGELKEALSDAVAEAEANDPAMLRKRIRDLEAKVAKGPSGDDERSHEEGRRKGFAQGYAAASSSIAGHVRGVVEKSNAFLSELADVAQHAKDFGTALDVLQSVLEEPAPELGPTDHAGRPVTYWGGKPTPAPQPRPTITPAKTPVSTGAKLNGGDELGKGERVVLTAIAQAGDDGADPSLLYVVTGYKARSITDYVGRLRKLDYVGADWPARATAAGFAALGSTFEPLPTGDRLRAHWLARLTGGERSLLDVLCGAHPHGMNNEDLGRMTRYASRSVTDYLGRLKARRLVERRGGLVYASGVLFGR